MKNIDTKIKEIQAQIQSLKEVKLRIPLELRTPEVAVIEDVAGFTLEELERVPKENHHGLGNWACYLLIALEDIEDFAEHTGWENFDAIIEDPVWMAQRVAVEALEKEVEELEEMA